MFYSRSPTTFVYSPSRNSSSFSRARPRKINLPSLHEFRISPCSSLGASQHSSILQCEIPLRFRERGLPAPAREPNRPILILTSRLEINSVCEWPGNAMYLAPSPTTFLYSPFRNSSSFPRTRPPRPQLARPGSQKRRGISRWGIDECCEAPRVEHCDIPRLENGNEFVKIRQNENRSILYVNTYK